MSNKYAILTVGEVVVERSSESILRSSIFEGGEERLQFLWGVQTWNFTWNATKSIVTVNKIIYIYFFKCLSEDINCPMKGCFKNATYSCCKTSLRLQSLNCRSFWNVEHVCSKTRSILGMCQILKGSIQTFLWNHLLVTCILIYLAAIK